MQTSMNIMDAGADVTKATQQKLWSYARTIAPDREGGAEPEAWAIGLQRLGYGNYEVSIQPTLQAAIQLAAKQVRLTNRPAGLMVWRGVHSWVMSGFEATRDPARDRRLHGDRGLRRGRLVSAPVEHLGLLEPAGHPGSGEGPPASTSCPGTSSYDGPHPDKDGKYVIVIPVTLRHSGPARPASA